LSTAVDGLAELGLKAKDLRGLSPEDQFKLIAKRLSTIEDPSKRAAVAVQLLGRAGTKLLPLMEDGASGVEALQQQARDLGLTVSTDAAKGAAALTDALNILWKQTKRAAFGIGGALAPAILKAATWIGRIASDGIRWIDANKGIIISITKLIGLVLAAGAALVTLGAVVGAAGSALGVMVTIITTLLSPIGLVIGAIVGLGVAIFKYTDFGAKALQWLSDRFGFLADEVSQTLGAIGSALASGGIQAAARVLWAFLKLEWTRGVNFLETKWAEFKDGFIMTAYDAMHTVRSLWESGVHAITLAWINGTAAMKTVWANFTAWHARTVESLANWMAKRWIEIQAMFDDTIDVNVAQKYIDQQSAQRFQQIEKDKTQAIDNAEAQRTQREQAAEQEHQRKLAQISGDHAKAIADLQNAHNQQVAGAAGELDAALKQYQDAVDSVKKLKPSATGGALPGAGRPELPKLDNVGSAIDSAVKKIGVRGTFNAASLQGLLAGGRVEDRIAKASEETARNTRRIERAITDNGITFA
jgi:hypothetical protein